MTSSNRLKESVCVKILFTKKENDSWTWDNNPLVVVDDAEVEDDDEEEVAARAAVNAWLFDASSSWQAPYTSNKPIIIITFFFKKKEKEICMPCDNDDRNDDADTRVVCRICESRAASSCDTAHVLHYRHDHL